jgi:hypothetical protein
VLDRLHPVGLVVHDLLDGHRSLGAQEPVEGDGTEQMRGRIDHEDLVEGLRQIRGVAHEVDGLPDSPERRDGDELRLHAPSGAVLGVVEGALERHALDGGKVVENLRLFFLRQTLEDGDGVIGIEFAHALRHRRGLEFLQDFLADRFIHLCEGGKVEGGAEKLDEAMAVLGLQGLEKIAEFGFVEVFDEDLQALGFGCLDGIGGGGQEFRIELAFLVPERRGCGFGPIGVRKQRLVFDFLHGPSSEGELLAF